MAEASSLTSSSTPAMTANRGDAPPGKLLKYTSYLYRNPSLTEAEFHEHWRSRHARLPIAAMKKHGIVKYSQYHCTRATRELARPSSEGRKAANRHVQYDMFEYDAVVQIWVEDIDAIAKMGGEDVFVDKIFADEEYLFDRKRCHVLVGWEEDILVDGKVLIPGYDEQTEGRQ
ncbi:uncharacterized protein B0I36DRAFT_365471 [Microdochium trichocladiopsis]|uniref:EthD domain-containing protein n=1 Tax=Microdochium trichocladiopsis TaxID=1682393 RepID=A0A9P8Y271_9PEZI|nr:uncharacterized protein B0I36DRAFT_365471 [Microdochium trichocladiopsis]KAH7025808.1 hypothetical protein B0I36DRAFT_365471 [Microdochium trichocladiopsis]